jgi:hypothetical protein
MGMSTVRHLAREQSAATTYWRRRFVALAVGLSVLALVTWAISGAMGGSTPAVSSAATKTVHGSLPSPPAAAAHTAPAAAGGGRNHGQAGQAGTAARPVTGRQSSGVLRPCPASDVVLSLFSSQASYSIRQTPQFEVDVVSTASQTCTFDIGSRHLWLQIKTGTVRVWTSADCAEGQASLVTALHRGVPTVVAIGWNGQISSPGCPVPGAAAGHGSYTAVAADSTSASNTLVFRLG